MFDDPHETARCLDPFRKDENLEEYFLRLNEHLEGFDQGEFSTGLAYPLIYIVGLLRSELLCCLN